MSLDMLISVMQIKNEYACEHYIIIGTITNLYFFGRNLLMICYTDYLEGTKRSLQ